VLHRGKYAAQVRGDDLIELVIVELVDRDADVVGGSLSQLGASWLSLPVGENGP
jgi:hypothetical protein